MGCVPMRGKSFSVDVILTPTNDFEIYCPTGGVTPDILCLNVGFWQDSGLEKTLPEKSINRNPLRITFIRDSNGPLLYRVANGLYNITRLDVSGNSIYLYRELGRHLFNLLEPEERREGFEFQASVTCEILE
jgi:hypothetical protein